MLEIKDLEKSTNELLVDVCKNQREMIKNMKNICIVIIISFCLIICTMVIGFFYYESQFDYEESITTTTTTDMETSGENANINNVTNGNMYNDNATHNE
jgi:hypothetical protein